MCSNHIKCAAGERGRVSRPPALRFSPCRSGLPPCSPSIFSLPGFRFHPAPQTRRQNPCALRILGKPLFPPHRPALQSRPIPSKLSQPDPSQSNPMLSHIRTHVAMRAHYNFRFPFSAFRFSPLRVVLSSPLAPRCFRQVSCATRCVSVNSKFTTPISASLKSGGTSTKQLNFSTSAQPICFGDWRLPVQLCCHPNPIHANPT